MGEVKVSQYLLQEFLRYDGKILEFRIHIEIVSFKTNIVIIGIKLKLEIIINLKYF